MHRLLTVDLHTLPRCSQIVGVAASFIDVWKGVSSKLAELDVLAGFADLSVNAPTPYVRPVMESKETGVLLLKGARHPCVELQVGRVSK